MHDSMTFRKWCHLFFMLLNILYIYIFIIPLLVTDLIDTGMPLEYTISKEALPFLYYLRPLSKIYVECLQ